MSTEIIVAAALIANAAVISEFFRWRRAVALQKTLQAALAAGALDVVEQLLARDREKPSAGLAIGAVLIAAGIAVAAYGAMTAPAEEVGSAVAAALFPLMIGVAIAGTSWLRQRGDKR